MRKDNAVKYNNRIGIVYSNLKHKIYIHPIINGEEKNIPILVQKSAAKLVKMIALQVSEDEIKTLLKKKKITISHRLSKKWEELFICPKVLKIYNTKLKKKVYCKYGTIEKSCDPEKEGMRITIKINNVELL